MAKIVFQFGDPNTGFKGAKSQTVIEVKQYANQRFSVTYGLQNRSDLTYAEAAHELGECIFHHQACQGLLDNGGP